MTWNVYMLPKPIKVSEQKIRSELQAEELKKIQGELDFVVLNEAFSKRSRDNISNALTEMPNVARLPRKGGILKVIDSGVMVMSRHPLKVLGQSYYKKCGKADCFASKGVLLVEVTLPSGKQIQVAATHMQSGKQPKYAAIRATQTAQIKELMDKYARPGVPQILAGDLNMDVSNPDEFSRALLELNMETPSYTGAISTSKSTAVSCFAGEDKEDPKQWLDHVLIRKQGGDSAVMEKEAYPLRREIKGKLCDLSDHLPVKAKIKVENSPMLECPLPGLSTFDQFEEFLTKRVVR